MKKWPRFIPGLLVDGRERVVRENYERIACEVRAWYADELSRAGWLRRPLLHFKIRREIRRRLDQIAPRDGLYLRT